MTTATITNSITLGLTANYCKGWTIVQAIREILANALDTHTKPIITWEAGVATVTDSGSGFHPNGLLIGETTKTNSDIGQYGEGLKVGAMVLLRNGSWITAESLGKRYTFKMEDSIVGTAVLTIYMEKCQTPKKGTIVRFACKREELDEAKSLFLAITPREKYDKQIIKQMGAIYVKGLLTEEVKAICGYDISAKDAMNRDRTVLNRDVVSREVRKALCQTKSYEAITDIIRACEDEGMRDCLEADCYFTPEHKGLWKRGFYDLYGKKACLSDKQSARASYLGFKCISLPWSIRHTLSNAGVKLDSEVVLKDASRSSRVTVTKTQRKVLAQAKAVLKPIFDPDIKVKYSIRVCKMESNGERQGNVIRINVERLDSLEHCISTLFHELSHMVRGNPDVDSSFEADLTKYAGRLAMALLERKTRKTASNRGKKGVSSPTLPSIPIDDGGVAEGAENPEKTDPAIAPEPVYASREPEPAPKPTERYSLRFGARAYKRSDGMFEPYVDIKRWQRFKHGGYGWAGMWGFPDDLFPCYTKQIVGMPKPTTLVQYYATRKEALAIAKTAIATFIQKMNEDNWYACRYLKRNSTGSW